MFLLFFRDKDKRRPYDEACLEPDKDGFCIEYGVLVSYVGNAKEITIPEKITVKDLAAELKEKKTFLLKFRTTALQNKRKFCPTLLPLRKNTKA